MKKFMVAVGFLLALTRASYAQEPDNSPLVSLRDPAYADFDVVAQYDAAFSGRGHNSTTEAMSHRPVTRLEFAVSLARVLAWRPRSQNAVTPGSLASVRNWGSDTENVVPPGPIGEPATIPGVPGPAGNLPVVDAAPIVAAAKRLALKFSPELRKFGIHLRDLKLKSTQASGIRVFSADSNPEQLVVSQPFGDVVVNHWATTAIEMLRLNGILMGYPAEAHKITR